MELNLSFNLQYADIDQLLFEMASFAFLFSVKLQKVEILKSMCFLGTDHISLATFHEFPHDCYKNRLQFISVQCSALSFFLCLFKEIWVILVIPHKSLLAVCLVFIRATDKKCSSRSELLVISSRHRFSFAFIVTSMSDCWFCVTWVITALIRHNDSYFSASCQCPPGLYSKSLGISETSWCCATEKNSTEPTLLNGG